MREEYFLDPIFDMLTDTIDCVRIGSSSGDAYSYKETDGEILKNMPEYYGIYMTDLGSIFNNTKKNEIDDPIKKFINVFPNTNSIVKYLKDNIRSYTIEYDFDKELIIDSFNNIIEKINKKIENKDKDVKKVSKYNKKIFLKRIKNDLYSFPNGLKSKLNAVYDNISLGINIVDDPYLDTNIYDMKIELDTDMLLNLIDKSYLDLKSFMSMDFIDKESIYNTSYSNYYTKYTVKFPIILNMVEEIKYKPDIIISMGKGPVLINFSIVKKYNFRDDFEKDFNIDIGYSYEIDSDVVTSYIDSALYESIENTEYECNIKKPLKGML